MKMDLNFFSYVLRKFGQIDRKINENLEKASQFKFCGLQFFGQFGMAQICVKM